MKVNGEDLWGTGLKNKCKIVEKISEELWFYEDVVPMNQRKLLI